MTELAGAARDAIRRAEKRREVEERPYSEVTARLQHAANLEAAAKNPALAETAARFAARCLAARILTDSEAALKDELSSLAPRDKIDAAWADGLTKPLKLIAWRDKFHLPRELATGELKMFIPGLLPEGITFIGSLSGVGKTLLALSITRALRTQRNFLGVYPVTETVPVLYLVPEMGEKAFRKRLGYFHLLEDEALFVQTLADGVIPLSDPYLEAIIREIHPIVFLDTAIRFNPSDDENAARQNASMLASDIFRLVTWGAPSVVGLHHSPKYAAQAESLTLENVLRGTGDLGAMCDAVWGLRHEQRIAASGKGWDAEYAKESQELTRLRLECVKPRDFEPLTPITLIGRPNINRDGDFGVLAEEANADQLVADAIAENPRITTFELRRISGFNHRRLIQVATGFGWRRVGRTWQRAAQADAQAEQEDMAF